MTHRDVGFVFDLDGTLVDSAYQHVAAWQQALHASGIELATSGRMATAKYNLGVGLLSGGYGQEELERAGAVRVYDDPADLLRHIDEIGGRARRGWMHP